MTLAVNIAQSGSNNVTFRNRLINGNMVIDQRNAGASVTPNGTYTLDRWSISNSQTGKLTVQQNAGSVTLPAGFTNYLGITSTSAYSVLTGDYFWLGQKIEGFNVGDLAWGTASASAVTLSFKVYSSLTGTFGGVLRNNAGNYNYPFSYTVSSANTWTNISVTIAGPTSGTWVTNNGMGIELDFSIGMGSTYGSGTAGAWTTSNYYAPTGSVNVVSTNGATFYITGVQLEAGTTASPFEYRQYGTELALCQRYCEAIIAGGSNAGLWPIQAGSTTNSRGVYSFKVQKRASASFTNLVSNSYICQYGSGNFNPTAVNLAASNASGAFIDSTCSGLTLGQAGFQLEGTISNGATICLFTAEL